MKKIILFLLLLSIILSCLVSCSSSASRENKDDRLSRIVDVDDTDVTIGLSQAEFDKIIDKSESFAYRKYAFFIDKDGQNVAVEFGDSAVVDVHVFDAVNVTDESFEQIQEGMDIYNVIKLVGVPFRSVMFGISSTDFLTDTDELFRIQWSDDDITVVSVSKVDPN